MADPHGSFEGAPHPGHRHTTPGDTSQVALVPDDPNRWNWRRGLIVAAWTVLLLVAIAITGVYVVTGTDWGRERARRYAENLINANINGRAKIGRISGNLLTGVTVHDFSIVDSAGRPFVAVESVRGKYSISSILRKRLWFHDVVAVRPLVVLDRPPEGHWNWKHIFPRDTTPKPASEQTEWGDWLRFMNSKVIGGQLIVTSPWRPSARLSPAARDSAVRDLLGGGGRLVVKRVPGGFQKIVRLDSVTAAIPLLRLSEPGFEDRLLEVSAMRAIAYPFRPPAAIVRDVKGVFPFNNDSIWWKGAYGAMPNSKATGDGVYAFDSGDMTLTLHVNPARSADMRWVYPRLPANGRGKLDLALEWRGALEDYRVTNADVTLDDARVRGSLGITHGDTITIHNTDLRFSGVDTRTLEQLIPGFRSPRRGMLAGRAKVNGGRHALDMDTDVTFNDQRAGFNHVVAVGHVGFPGRGIRASNLRLRMMPVQVDIARQWFPTLPLHGTVTGSLVVNGNTASELRLAGDIDHRDRGTHSAMDGTATLRLTPSGRVSWFDVNVITHPISLVAAGRFLPKAGLHGSAAGPVRVTGTLDDMRVDANLRLPDGGRFAAKGTVAPAGDNTAYDLTAQLYTLNLRTVTTKGPVTSLTALAVARGRGFKPETMRTTLAADLSTSAWDSLAVDTASIRVNVAGGLADIGKLYVAGAHTEASATGSFGLARDRTGTLTYRVAVDSLGALNRWIPRRNDTTTIIAPRPGVMARALRRARADSARIDRATEIERMISGRPAPRLAVATPRSVPTATLSGTLYAAGTLAGNIFDFDLRGRGGGENVVARGNFVRRFKSEYAWENARSPQSSLAVALDADSLSALGFAFDTLNARLTYKKPGGHIEVAVIQDQHREYAAKGDYALFPDRKEMRLVDMTFRFDTVQWSMTRPSMIQWGGPGLRVTDFELRNGNSGRIYADGLLPTEGAADVRLDIDNFPVSNIVDITQTDIDAGGVLTLRSTMTGTLASPAFRGAFGLVNGVYDSTPVPDLRGRFGYADRELMVHAEALRDNGNPITTIDARLPINLAFTGVTGDRLLPLPMTVDFVADSLPLELIPKFTDVVSNVRGHAAGKIAMRGTLRRPSLAGGISIDHGAMTIVATGATIEDISGIARMVNDTVYVDSVAGWAKGPVRVRGTLAVGTWREPALNLYLISEGAQLFDNHWGKVRVDAGVALTGPFDDAYLSGALTITQGVLYAPEPTGRNLISAGDPALFNVLDTAVASDREIFPKISPLFANLRMEVTLAARHNTWVRNRSANVEVYTEEPLFVRAEHQSIALTGVVTTDRGDYNFLSKRFHIKRGSAMFIGTAEVNPTLQITGEYQVQTASRGVINIQVQIGGTLRQPRLSLDSDAQPPKTQSELLSLLAFGQSTTSLLASASSSIAGSAATADLFGVGAQVAVRRLAGVALGVAVDQVAREAGRTFGTDVFDITPADVPSGNITRNLFKETKFEAGKYINPRTFVTAQFQANRPGIGIDHRTQDGWRFSAAIAPQLLLREPRLNEQPVRTVRSYGGFIAREWRF